MHTEAGNNPCHPWEILVPGALVKVMEVGAGTPHSCQELSCRWRSWAEHRWIIFLSLNTHCLSAGPGERALQTLPQSRTLLLSHGVLLLSSPAPSTTGAHEEDLGPHSPSV